MKNLLYILIFLSFQVVFSQEKVTLSGTVTDAKTNETLIGVSVVVQELATGMATNEYGFYSLTMPKGTYKIQVSYLGYETLVETLTLTDNKKWNIALTEQGQQLSEITVSQTQPKINIKKPEISVNKLSIQSIKNMPAVLGEVDVLKAILQLPGVTNAGEGSSGFNVRGGSADQNLVLLDEATVYSSSHMFGFFSVFNADAIKDLKLYKGGIPARFGGRLSSVLDIYQKEGNSNSYHVNGGIGLISSRLLAEGPIQKEKSSFLFAGRSSYAHLFLKLSDNENSAYFYDLNTKLNYKINDKNNLFLSGYFGRDVFEIAKSFTNTYGNTTLNVRWNHLFSDKIFSNLSFIYSDYYYGLNLNFIGFKWDSGIKNYNIKYDIKNYVSDKLKVFSGINLQYYHFNPGEITPEGEKSGINPEKLDQKYAFEPALFIEAEQNLSEKFTVNYGLRYSLFYRLGNQTLNIYTNNQAVNFNNVFKIYEKAEPIGTKSYAKNEVIASFNNLEPRLAFAYSFNENQSVKVGYNRMAQYLHLISNTSSPTPLDVWAPSDDFLKPQMLDQVALGYFQNFKDDKYSVEIETFYKKISNKIDYIDGADLIANRAVEQIILNGRARAYGLELLLRKNEGKLNGWVSYTLSRTEQQTPGRTSNEIGINNGNWYKNAYDKLHNLSVTATYKLSEKWNFGTIFALQSGQPVTYPNGQYVYQGISVPSYGLRNENRLPAYHHLDISATYQSPKNKGRNWKSEWVFSIYNLYNRKNAASISFRQNTETAQNEAVRLSIFGIVPSVTYNFKW